jgi:plasmid maintenance system antidote protein VapI
MGWRCRGVILNLQSAYDLRRAEIAAGRRIAREVSAITGAA